MLALKRKEGHLGLALSKVGWHGCSSRFFSVEILPRTGILVCFFFHVCIVDRLSNSQLCRLTTYTTTTITTIIIINLAILKP